MEPILAEGASADFELVGNVLDLVPHVAVVVKVGNVLLEGRYEALEVEVVEGGVLKGLDLIGQLLLGDKVEGKDEGLVAFDHDLVNYLPVAVRSRAVVDEPDLSASEDPQVEVIGFVPDDLFRVRHKHLYLFGQVVDGLFHHELEEGQLVEDALVGLLQKVVL
jgi:hypothetical protein